MIAFKNAFSTMAMLGCLMACNTSASCTSAVADHPGTPVHDLALRKDLLVDIRITDNRSAR
jgi:hypothetical protein